MKKGINYWAFPPQADGSPADLLAALKHAKELGYDCFEVTVERTGLISVDTTREQAESVRREAERLGIALVTSASGLAWGESPSDSDPQVRGRAIQTFERAMEVSSWLGITTMLYLPGMVSAVFVPDFEPQPYEKVYERAREAVQALLPTAERVGVKLAVENVWNRFLLSPLEMRAFIDSFESELIGSYFDVGNVLAFGHPEDWIRTLGKRILAVHLKDFKVSVGNLDGFVDLLSGDVNYPAVMKAFKEIGYEGTYTAEIVPGMAGAAEKAIAAMKIIERY